MVITETESLPSWWKINLLWVAANLFSVFGGILLGAFLNHILWVSNVPPRMNRLIVDGFITNPIQRAIIMGISIGGIKGLLEWFILQKYQADWKGWFLISVLAWSIGVTSAAGLPQIGPSLHINELVGGIFIGVIQWILLRYYVPKSYWWIIATIVGSFAVLSYIPLGFVMILENFIPLLISGLMMGIITGATIVWLLQLFWLREE
jgi:hypothetical protein